MYYSQSTGCVYLPSVHGAAMPADAVPISEKRYKETLASPKAGMVRSHDAEGLPILVDMLPPSSDELAAAERAWRDAEVLRVSWLRDRHRDQVEVDLPTTLTGEQFAELLEYLQTLRDWPQSEAFPDMLGRPPLPEWVVSQTQ